MEQKLSSEQIVLAAPMSFSGSRARIWRVTGSNNVWLKWLALIPIGLILIATAWCAVAIWYVIFGIWLIPYRLFRRGQRKNKKHELQHRELLDAVKHQG